MSSKAITFVIVALCASALALPSSAHSLEDVHIKAKRDNDWHLKCSNAPDHEGGYALDPATVPAPPQVLPETGSSNRAFRYMWCTPGTETYTFFNQWAMVPPPLQYADFVRAINETGQSYANQADIQVPDGRFTSTPAGTHVEVYMENSKGTLTWGIVNSALSGLWQYMTLYGESKNPLIFQVNDGGWGEVGIGYAAFKLDKVLDGDDRCILGGSYGKLVECKDLKKMIDNH